jgi:hypothetical protein
MKILLLLLSSLAFAQDKSALLITVVAPDGTQSTSSIEGAPAAAGLQVLAQYMASQQVCEVDGDGNKINCKPKYPTMAAYIRALVIERARVLAPEHPSSQLKPLIDDLKTRQAAIETVRKTLFDAAAAQ